MADPVAVRRTIVAAGVLWTAVLLTLSSPWARAADADLTEAQQRGKRIYLEGTSPSEQPITVVMGEEKLPLPARAATCGGCHGHDGTGRPESGILPYNVTWPYLTKSYGHVHDSGLEHGPFTPESLKIYLRTGVYPGGERGDPSMPLYGMSEEDLDDLVAYLERLGDDVDPGIGAETVTIGTVLPPTGRFGELATAIRQLLEAWVADVNLQGGIYGREITLVVHELVDDPALAPGVLRTWLAAQQPFALVSPFAPDMEAAVGEAAAEEEILLIGPWTLYPENTFSRNRHVFYLYSGLAEQLRSLVRFAVEQLEVETARVAVLAADTTPSTLLEAVREAVVEVGWQEVPFEPFPVRAFDAETVTERLRRTGADIVVSLAVDRELRSFLEAAAASGWTPHVLAPGALAGDLIVKAPAAFDERLVCAYPTLPNDRTPWGVGELSRLLADVDGGESHVQAMISAYSATAVLTEAMRRAGRNLGRRELTAALEGFYQFETGLTPPITYTNNRRIGANGAYVVAYQSEPPDDRGELLRSAPWIEVE